MPPAMFPKSMYLGCNGIMKALRGGRIVEVHARPRRHRVCCEGIVKRTTRKRVQTIAKEDDSPSASAFSLSNMSLQGDAGIRQAAPSSGRGSPEVLDLHAGAPQGGRWDQIQRWLVFSDLHVTFRTLDVCRQVLRRVKAEAKAREAGILFLGDFWHSRGALPIVPLNVVLEEFQDWQQPTIMLVGNHDQVSLGGLEHGLTAMAAACPSVHIMEQPTLFLGALWLPYRRQHADLEAALKAAGPVKAVFAHADVVHLENPSVQPLVISVGQMGAFVNDVYQAREGVSPELFSSGTVTYMGHYHKPHVVKGTTITYVGSPYQVSRSEAGQKKALLVLDANWQEVDRIPLDIGPRYFSLTSSTPRVPRTLRRADRVRWNLPEGMSLADAQDVLAKLEAKGVEVELIVPPPMAAPRIEAAEEMGTAHLFEAYAASTGLTPEAKAAATHILQGVEAGEQQLSAPLVDLEFHSIRLEGYGPFREAVDYNVAARGVRVVTGDNQDNPDADSNGAGKSALVMAPMWALTGRSDARVEGGGSRGLTSADVVNDEAKTATVRVTGRVNGDPFVVERSVRRRGLAKLTLEVGGVDMTGAEARITQANIDRMLAADLLGRAVFFGQSDINSLLEASDRDFKAELGRVVDMDVWEAAKTAAADALRESRSSLSQLEGEQSVRQNMLARLQHQAAAAAESAAAWESHRSARSTKVRTSYAQAQLNLRTRLATAQGSVAPLRDWLSTAAAQSGAPAPSHNTEVQKRRSEGSTQAGRAGNGPEPDGEATSAEGGAGKGRDGAAVEVLIIASAAQVEKVRQELLDARTVAGRCAGALQASHKQAEEYALLASHSHNGNSSMVCDRCLQTIDKVAYSANLDRLQADAAHTRAAWEKARDRANNLQAALEEEQKRLRHLQQDAAAQAAAQAAAEAAERARKQRAAAAEQEERVRWARAQEARAALVRLAKSAVSRVEACLQRRLPLLGEIQLPAPVVDRLLSDGEVERLCNMCEGVTNAADEAGQELVVLQQRMNALETETNPHSAESERLKSLVADEMEALTAVTGSVENVRTACVHLADADKAFGPAGVQSFALEAVLGELQACSSGYLEQLSLGFALSLSATRTASRGGSAALERISKTVHVRAGKEGELKERSLRQLSGGERRRVALALALGFAQLVSARGRLRCNMLVLDEVLQQLDAEGCARAASVLRKLSQRTILVVGQAHSFITQEFDAVDVVVKKDGCSFVESDL